MAQAAEHGTRAGYRAGCTCLLCRAAESGYRMTLRRLRAMQRATPGQRIRAVATWRRIRSLLGEGFTKADLARRIGRRSAELDLPRRWVTVRTAARIRRIYEAFMAEGHELPWHREEER